MRHIIRRLMLFPVAVIGAPLFYFIAWCLDGHKLAFAYTKAMLTEVWG